MCDAAQHTSPEQSPWRRFWERGGWWRALLLAAVYYGLYQLMALLVEAVFPAEGGVRGESGSPTDVLIGTALPIVLGSCLLLAFAASLGCSVRSMPATSSPPTRAWRSPGSR